MTITTYPLKSPPVPPLRSPLLVACALGTAGFALNRVGIPIFGDAEIHFGPWASLLGVFWLGPWWGAAIAAVSASSLGLNQHYPTGMICQVLEAVVAGHLVHRRQWKPLPAVLAYWLTVGTPLAAAMILCDGTLPLPDNWIRAVCYPTNSLLMAAAVLPFFQSRRFRIWAGLPLDQDARTSLQRVLFRRFGLIVALSLAATCLFAGRLLDGGLRESAEGELVADSRELAQILERFLEKHVQAVSQMAGANRVTTVARYSLEPQLGNLHSVYPAFLTTLAADETGRVVAAAPNSFRTGPDSKAAESFNVADRDYFRQAIATSQPFISSVFRGRGFGRDLIVAISAPILTPARRPIGIIEGSLNLRHLLNELSESGQLGGRSIVVVDHAGQVVASLGELHRPTLADFSADPWFRSAGATTDDIYSFNAASAGTPVHYIGSRHLVSRYRWQIYLAEPVWNFQRAIAGYYLGTLLAGALATILALWLTRGVAHEITRPLADLARAIHRLSEDREAVLPSLPPTSRELTELSAELHGAALRLSRANRELAHTVAERDQTQENLRGLLLHLEDLVRERTTELEQARTAAESASQAKTDFLASMSHELRTPLNVIVGMSELMCDQTLGPLNPRQLEGIRNVHESGRHLLELINDILDLSKIEAGQLELDPQPMDVESVCASSVRFVRDAARRGEIRLETVVPADLPPTLADERRVKQILVNLLANAVKFTPAGGTVGLEASVDPVARELHFEIRDTGIGIDPANFERIFQPFQQIDSSLSRQYAGTGLGLALVRRMAALHHGKVSVESTLGRGSRFRVTLPWSPEVPAAASVATESAPPGPAGADAPLRILIAEDNTTNRLVYSNYFATRPCEITFADNGQQAIECVHAQHPDLVLMDVHMPVLDGLSAIERLRADPRTAALPIIAVTALAMPEDRARCLAAGATAYLSKPINLRELGRLITRCTDPARRVSEPVSPS